MNRSGAARVYGAMPIQPPYPPESLSCDTRPQFIVNSLIVSDPGNWIPATELTSGTCLDVLFELPYRLWAAPPHAAVTLAWKTYTYRLAQPLAAAWTMAREVPLLSADNVLFQLLPEQPYISIGLRRPTTAVLPTHAARRSDGAVVLADEERQLDFLRSTLIEEHLVPMLRQTTAAKKISERALWGQAAAAFAYAFADISVTAAADANRFTALLPVPGLAGVGEDDTVWRDTCCLAFASPALTACRDCVTVSRARRTPRRLVGHAARILHRESRDHDC
ncbi:IucA/IucC family C-terminal-domain containing protein [Actinocrinis sp.]|uniref:IucA/IucC family C-terminal-domain containing protein n=1 Tax=Actinocrinis sp. TaxID=1920516 RepID=UPI002D600AE9|nr:IucA/IucC family C-terminal-domain containing protein [Actinocrinis sp.]HZP49947.1 IucA/IucC family C-terminal-domain containing protein [Actinocrinis sp.]